MSKVSPYLWKMQRGGLYSRVSFPDSMTVVEVAEAGPPEGFRLARRPLPSPAAGEVLLKVSAAGVNRADVMQRQGKYPPPPGASDILGLEVSGTIEMLGDGVRDLALHDQVCALLTGGGYAEYCVVPAPQCLPCPRLSLIHI